MRNDGRDEHAARCAAIADAGERRFLGGAAPDHHRAVLEDVRGPLDSRLLDALRAPGRHRAP